eukprot:TRINITY_DN47661_c0_g1_i1.p1 TRINITY_DN47661_c0_g1~~TRINITY_DN47661_c0_g1_i1.p1  ORF type:complete len:228 (+),score=31.61 TRINITY_DN47661_c0_g1_i1:80-763(+)
MAKAARISVRTTNTAGDEAFATKTFHAGDVVLVDRPFAVLKTDMPSLPSHRVNVDDVSADDLEECINSLNELRAILKELCSSIVSYQPPDATTYWNALAAMSCPDLSMSHPVLKEVDAICTFLAVHGGASNLFHHWPDSSSEALVRTVLTWMTNCLSYQGKSALFPLASKVNHSCDANVQWDASQGHFIALRDIHAGDALGMSYLNLDTETTFDRCSALYQQFFFWR